MITFVTRNEAAMRFGLIDASQLAKWKRRNWPLPKGFKPAMRVAGEVYPAKHGERLHSDIAVRIGQLGGDYDDGYIYETNR